MKKTQKNEKPQKNSIKNKSKKNKVSNSLTKLYGSVCTDNSTIKTNSGLFAGINQFNQISTNEKGEVMWGKGIQLYKGFNDQRGYIKEHDWNNPKNYRIRYFKLDKFGPGNFAKLLPKSKIQINGSIQTLNAGGTYTNDNKKIQDFAASFDATGNNYIAMIK